MELAVTEAEHMLLWGGAGDGSQPCSHGAWFGRSRQQDGEHSDVVLFGLCSRRHGAGAAWVVASVRHQQRHPEAVGGCLLLKHIGGIGDGIGGVGAMANITHQANPTLEDIQVLPVSEVVLY